MHTSSLLKAEDFQYQTLDGRTGDFLALFPDYHLQDRIAVVSPRLEDGIFGASYAVLAFTTAFYDALRAQGTAFFDYPQHFSILDWDGQGVQTGVGRLTLDTETIGAAWSHLDVWPECKWKAGGASAKEMLRAVFDLQINRILWPDGFDATDPMPPLPGYMRQILATHLKQVMVYATDASALTIEATGAALELAQTAATLLPGSPTLPPALQTYHEIPVADFLSLYAAVFE